MQTFTHIITDPSGLHARPAGLLVKVVSSYHSAVTVTTATGSADAKRILALMRLAAKEGSVLTVTVEGEDEITAAEEIKTFLKENL